MPVSAFDVADFFLFFQTPEEAGDLISNLKLQKLLYYAQGLYLAKYGRPLFPERIEAWTHGPVVPRVYHHFKEHGFGSIPKPANCPELSKRVQRFLTTVFRVYGQYSAWKLRDFTHQEAPWKETEEGCVISHASLRKYFRTQLA